MTAQRYDTQPGNWHQMLFEHCADPILVMKGNSFVDCNEAAIRALGAESKQQLLELQPWQISPEKQPDGALSSVKHQNNVAIALEQGSHRFDWKHLRLDGTPFPVEAVLTVLDPENPIYLHVSWRDSSQREQLQRELKHTQKIDAIGKMVSGIAHDFNNQLMPVVGYSEILRAQLRDSPRLLGYVDYISHAARHAADLVERLMVFSRKETEEHEVSDLSDVVYKLSEMLHSVIGEDVVFSLESSGEPMPVNLSPGDVEQIVLNLISNARDALGSGGKITLSLMRYEGDGESEALLSVRDNGCGMDSEQVKHVFEPFFTTKETGKGTGLGMASVYSVVQRAKGGIHVESAPGVGTVVLINLPLVNPPETESLPELDVDVFNGAREAGQTRVLIVEDDESAGVLLRTALEAEGFRVTLAQHGQDALRAADDVAFDIVISDVVMPDMSGPALVNELRARGKRMSVLYMSGYVDSRLQALDIDLAEAQVLRKPFAPSALVSQIWQELGIGPLGTEACP